MEQASHQAPEKFFTDRQNLLLIGAGNSDPGAKIFEKTICFKSVDFGIAIATKYGRKKVSKPYIQT